MIGIKRNRESAINGKTPNPRIYSNFEGYLWLNAGIIKRPIIKAQTKQKTKEMRSIKPIEKILVLQIDHIVPFPLKQINKKKIQQQTQEQ